MGLEEKIRKLRDQQKGTPLDTGVAKSRIAAVCLKLGYKNNNIEDAIYALTDGKTKSWFANTPAGATVRDGATTAHIGSHIGILQRGGDRKLDREGRDYWLKPMCDLGAIEPVYLDSKTKTFVDGHPVAKSGNCGYRLSKSFLEILNAPESKWAALLTEWNSADARRERAEFQAKAAAKAASTIVSKHTALINACVEHYAPRFLPGYNVVYVDDGDGDRVTQEDKTALEEAGLEIGLDDPMPDVLLWNPDTEWLWVIEAVTSDGEVDLRKQARMTEIATRSKKSGVGFTTAYETWQGAAARQGTHKNIAPDTYIWIRQDGSKHLHLVSAPAKV